MRFNVYSVSLVTGVYFIGGSHQMKHDIPPIKIWENTCNFDRHNIIYERSKDAALLIYTKWAKL